MDKPRIMSEPRFSDQERENLKKIFRKADQEAEKMDRHDCLRVQKKLAEIRQQYGIDE